MLAWMEKFHKVPPIDTELGAISVWWERRDETFLGKRTSDMSSNYPHLISPKHIYVSNTKLTHETIFIHTYLYIYIYTHNDSRGAPEFESEVVEYKKL